MHLPEKFISQMKDVFGNDFDAYLASFSLPREAGLRVNLNKITPEEFEKICPFKLERIPWTTDGYYVDPDLRPAKHPFYHAGLYYMQEPSAMAPVNTMHIENGERILDLCSAPGGKTLQIANRVGESGLVVSNDISASRLRAVVKNIEQFGLKNVIITSEQVDKLANLQREFYDRILVDAPCSGEGMFRKDPSIAASWSEASNDEYHAIQSSLAEGVQPMLKGGGQFLYSTCTFSPVENESVIEGLLNAHSELTIEDIDSEYFEDGIAIGGDERLRSAKRLYPFKLRGEGHFLASLIKDGRLEANVNPQKDQPAPEELQAFMKEVLHEPIVGSFRVHNDKILLDPQAVPDLKGIRVLRRGWLLGELVKGRFEPAQSFAMGLKKEWIKNTITFGYEEIEVVKYLKCETLHVDYPNGWYVVCMGDFPLGWAKVVNGQLKNKYPAAWRMV
ncbi:MULTISPECIES: RsmF rRNA methyltransferase first C-terminal domain-containing protein [unclassified Fusibacter]|uniref:RsmF rRNA methyltransferase first C-terminal domain-containing protein n=1 Tax=unclassified Fusibacter TaxID=2624464 RepID=UPI0010124CEB|nr:MULTISPECIES: RsmB/NOP family class I SAM-dependent RNA methyltransferase [unclassified Fusibacter]MCK8060592.1 RsmB/NOP family class I SAM-dependent RNA methyltransferase [Fusibacter sp. A2]NPE22954.1 SAM-dependent methyltransferase [Fusibacter sp. A1]RXV60020.1 SAM-dependent methyltransferase [Fusibacter sp. A1]